MSNELRREAIELAERMGHSAFQPLQDTPTNRAWIERMKMIDTDISVMPDHVRLAGHKPEAAPGAVMVSPYGRLTRLAGWEHVSGYVRRLHKGPSVVKIGRATFTRRGRRAWDVTGPHEHLGTHFSAHHALNAAAHLLEADPIELGEGEVMPSRPSAMVGLYPPADVAQQLALDGGAPPESLHVTLVFLGPVSDTNPEALKAAVREWAANTPPLSGQISGYGHFVGNKDGDGGKVTYASVDLPALPDARNHLVGAIERAGLEHSKDHGFTPHMTLDYAHRRPQIDPMDVTFPAATVKLGKERHDMPFKGVLHEAFPVPFDELGMSKHPTPEDGPRRRLRVVRNPRFEAMAAQHTDELLMVDADPKDVERMRQDDAGERPVAPPLGTSPEEMPMTPAEKLREDAIAMGEARYSSFDQLASDIIAQGKAQSKAAEKAANRGHRIRKHKNGTFSVLGPDGKVVVPAMSSLKKAEAEVTRRNIELNALRAGAGKAPEAPSAPAAPSPGSIGPSGPQRTGEMVLVPVAVSGYTTKWGRRVSAYTQHRKGSLPGVPGNGSQRRAHFVIATKIDPEATIQQAGPEHVAVEFTHNGEQRLEYFGKDGKAVPAAKVPSQHRVETKAKAAATRAQGAARPELTTPLKKPLPARIEGEPGVNPAIAHVRADGTLDAVPPGSVAMFHHGKESRWGYVINHPYEDAVHIYDLHSRTHHLVDHSRIDSVTQGGLGPDRLYSMLDEARRAAEAEHKKARKGPRKRMYSDFVRDTRFALMDERDLRHYELLGDSYDPSRPLTGEQRAALNLTDPTPAEPWQMEDWVDSLRKPVPLPQQFVDARDYGPGFTDKTSKTSSMQHGPFPQEWLPALKWEKGPHHDPYLNALDYSWREHRREFGANERSQHEWLTARNSEGHHLDDLATVTGLSPSTIRSELGLEDRPRSKRSTPKRGKPKAQPKKAKRRSMRAPGTPRGKKLAAKERVRHERFGAGQVIEVLPNGKVKVRFSDGSVRTLLSGYLERRVKTSSKTKSRSRSKATEALAEQAEELALAEWAGLPSIAKMIGHAVAGAAGSASHPRPLFPHEGAYHQAFKHNARWAVPGPWHTQLHHHEERRFRRWVQRYKIPVTKDYDMRGYFRASGGAPHTPGTHFPDTYKTPYDTTFSNQSRYAKPGTPFVWKGNKLINRRTGNFIAEVDFEDGLREEALVHVSRYSREGHPVTSYFRHMHAGMSLSPRTLWHVSNGEGDLRRMEGAARSAGLPDFAARLRAAADDRHQHMQGPGPQGSEQHYALVGYRQAKMELAKAGHYTAPPPPDLVGPITGPFKSWYEKSKQMVADVRSTLQDPEVSRKHKAALVGALAVFFVPAPGPLDEIAGAALIALVLRRVKKAKGQVQEALTEEQVIDVLASFGTRHGYAIPSVIRKLMGVRSL